MTENKTPTLGPFSRTHVAVCCILAAGTMWGCQGLPSRALAGLGMPALPIMVLRVSAARRCWRCSFSWTDRHGLPRPPAGQLPLLALMGMSGVLGMEPALLPQPAGLLPGRGGDPSVHSPKHCRALLHFDLEGPAHQAQALRPGPGLSGVQLCGGPLKRFPLPLRPRSAPRPGLGADLRLLHALWPKSPHLARGADRAVLRPALCGPGGLGPVSDPRAGPGSSRPPGPSRRPSA